MPNFPTTYPEIIARLQAIDPATYATTRNYLNGAVTLLSPYLTHGVLTTKEVGRVALAKATYREAETLLRELAWCDFYRTMWEQIGDAIFKDVRFTQPRVQFDTIPSAITTATTGITAIDEAITALLTDGYMHNHARLWVAMLCSTIAQTAWWQPSRWMYYHLLDGDLASNSLSWQWVAGSSRKEPYVANQANLNTFSGTVQRGTFLDVPTEVLYELPIPEVMAERTVPVFTTTLPVTPPITLSGEVLLYHAWSLDPFWHAEDTLPRVLLLEPSHFSAFPISEKRVAFILALAHNIPNLTVVVTDFADFAENNPEARFTFTQHPAVTHWTGQSEPQEKLFTVSAPVTGDWSFSKFWSRCLNTLNPDGNA